MRQPVPAVSISSRPPWVAVFHCDAPPATRQEFVPVARAVRAMHPLELTKTAIGGSLDVTLRSPGPFGRRFWHDYKRFPEVARRWWDPGHLYRLTMHPYPEHDRPSRDSWTCRVELEEPAPPGSRRRKPFGLKRLDPRFLGPQDLELAAQRVVHQMISQGLIYRPSDELEAQLAVTNIAGDRGQSTHILRLRTTIPDLNEWVNREFARTLLPVLDQDVILYTGFYTTIATHPFGLIGVASAGGENRIMTLGGLHLTLDTNLQYRLHTADGADFEGWAVEVNPGVAHPGRRFSVGFSSATTIASDPDYRLAVVGNWKF